MKRALSILALLCVGLSAVAWIPPHRHAQPAHTAGGTSYLLLDTPGVLQFPETPCEALRLLTTNYAGKCCSVITNNIETSNVAEIGWMTNAQGKILVDVSAIETFAAGNDVWIYNWYDQTTNAAGLSGGHVGGGFEVTSPKIAVAGVVITNNGMPAIDTSEMTYAMISGSSVAPSSYEFFWIGSSSSTGNQALGLGPNLNVDASLTALTNQWGAYFNAYAASGYQTTGHRFFNVKVANYNDANFYTDNNAPVAGGGTAYTSPTATYQLFGYGPGGEQHFSGYVQEVVWISASTNDTAAIKANCNAFWNLW